MTLTDFLLARIAEDEAAAGGGETHWVMGAAKRRRQAECEAKRRIVERCRPGYLIVYRESERLLAAAFDQQSVQTVGHSDAMWPFDAAETILQTLALPYADHPDYQQEWRP